MKKSLKILFALFVAFLPAVSIAQNYLAVDQPGKVYDDAASKYVTLNEKNEDVSILPGMVFKSIEKKPGVVMIEYSPGLRGFIDENITSPGLVAPSPGTYQIANQSGKTFKVEVDDNGKWKGISENATYPGILADNNIVVFVDPSGNVAYSLVDLGKGGIVMNYDNNITKFF